MIHFLRLTQVLRIHERQIERFGGSHGIRDRGLLESAMAMPEAGFGDEYFHKDVFEMASAYLYHLANNHPFHDGNKRVAAMAAMAFLHLNGYEMMAAADEYEALVFSVARGEADKPQIAAFFRDHTRPLGRSGDPSTD